MADVQQQLSTLLGTRVKQLRITEESPPNISVIDVVAAITGLSSSNAAVAFTRLKNEHPDVTARCSHVNTRSRVLEVPFNQVSGAPLGSA